MSRLILLDSGPLGMATNPKAKGIPLECQQWLRLLLKRGEQVAIPEIADYEVRRELMRARLLQSLERLDNLKQILRYIPIQTDTIDIKGNSDCSITPNKLLNYTIYLFTFLPFTTPFISFLL